MVPLHIAYLKHFEEKECGRGRVEPMIEELHWRQGLLSAQELVHPARRGRRLVGVDLLSRGCRCLAILREKRQELELVLGSVGEFEPADDKDTPNVLLDSF